MIKNFKQFINEETETLSPIQILQKIMKDVRSAIEKISADHYIDIFGEILNGPVPHKVKIYPGHEMLNVGKFDCGWWISGRWGEPLLFKNEPTDEQLKKGLEQLKKDVVKAYGDLDNINIIACRPFAHDKQGKVYPFVKTMKNGEGYVVGFDVEVKDN